MAGQSRSSHKYLLLQVWCALLTVSMVAMAAMLISVKTQSGQVGVSTLRPNDSSPTAGPFQEALHSAGKSLSYIQLIRTARRPRTPTSVYERLRVIVRNVGGVYSKAAGDAAAQDRGSWEESPVCQLCSLRLLDDSILCEEDGLYWVYALVSFRKQPGSGPARSVVLRRNAGPHRSEKTLVEGTFPNTTEGSVWVAKIVKLMKGDQVSLDLREPILKAPILKDNTHWGAYRLR